MKKFFQRLDNSSSRHQQQQQSYDYNRESLGVGGGGSSLVGGGGQSSNSSYGGSFIGKVFTLGQYHCTVEDIIAEGGFALVFLVKAQSSLGRFALKRLHVNNEADLVNCKREIEIAKQLGSHKNIVQLVEWSINYTASNGVYEILMLMQYCRGHLLQLLNDKIKEGGLPETEVLRIACDLCEAVARMHHNEPPIIHRDLKVENILISEAGTYLLCDFGSATTKILSTSPDLGNMSALAIEEEIKRYTTLAYRSPEMVDVYSGKSISTKADIWALGCLLYKLCFLTMPFGESTLAIQNAQLTVPDSAEERYSTKLLSLLGYLLTSDPDERPDIYQVSALVFSLAAEQLKNPSISNPVPNRTVTKTVKVPKWTKLKVPPTESQARESRDASSRKVSTVSGSGVGGNATTATVSTTTETTTSVTPRQRPKASININSVLPTSPLPPFSANRAATPSDLTTTSSTTSGSTATTGNTLSVGHVTLTSSASFNSALRPSTVVDGCVNEDDEDDIDWSKKKAKAKSNSPPSNNNTQQSTSNPQLNSNVVPAETNVYDHPAASKNPFLGAAPTSVTSSIPQPLPAPPSSSSAGSARRHSQTPPSAVATVVTTTTAPSSANVHQHSHPQTQTQNHLNPNPNVPSHHHHHHRRNMSDTSAFSSANVAAAAATVAAAAAEASGHLTAPSSATRVRSLNPFEDPNDVSYEDTLFGHEFDRIRQEVTVTTSSSRHYQQQPNTMTTSNEATSYSSTPRLDPFEAAPFNPAQLKRYFERQQSSEASLASSNPSSATSGAPSISSKPYLVHVGSSASSEGHLPSTSKSNSTVITIRSNNDFVIHSNGQSEAGLPSSNIIASSSSAFVSLAPPAVVNAIDPLTAQSNSSSSQGQITLGPAASYMPLYSSDTAEDSSDCDSSAESSDVVDSSDDDSVKERKSMTTVGGRGSSTKHLNGNQLVEDEDDEDELVDGAHVAQEMSVDLMKPLVVDEEDEEEENEEVENAEEEDEEFGSSSIGSASDLQATDNSDDDDDEENDESESSCYSVRSSNSSSDDAERLPAEVVADSEVIQNLKLSQAKDITVSEKKTDKFGKTPSSSQESRDGFVFVNYDGTSSKGHPTNWIKYSGKNGSESTTTTSGSKKGAISRITITMDGVDGGDRELKTEAKDVEKDAEKSADQHNTLTTTDCEDGTSVGTSEVLSTTSSVASSTQARAINLDGTSASIDHLIGHIEGHRPLLEEEDYDYGEDEVVQQVKLIEMDLECEPIPSNTASSAGEANAGGGDSVMFNSMTSSVCSVVLKNCPETTVVDLLTEDPPISSVTDPSHLVIAEDAAVRRGSGGSSSEESDRRLDEEVAASLNSQVIYDQLTNKDLFGCVPFNDKDVIKTNVLSGDKDPAIKLSKTVVPVVEQQFESSFTELPSPSKMVSEPPPTLPKPIASSAVKVPPFTAVSPPQLPPVTTKQLLPQPSAPITTTKSTDLFGAIPFQQTVVVKPVIAEHPQNIKSSVGQTPLQIITLKPVNHQQLPPPVAPKPVITPQTVSAVTTTSMTTKPIITAKPTTSASLPVVAQAPKTAPKPVVQPLPLSPPSPSVVKSGTVVLLQKSNSSKLKKSKVAKKYEVDESDDEVDGLLEPDLLDDSEAVLPVDGKGKKEKKKDKKDKEKPDKKSKEKETKVKEKEKKTKEKTKEAKPDKEKKAEKVKEEKVKELKKSKEEKEKEKLEKKRLKAEEKAAAEKEKLEAKKKEKKASKIGTSKTDVESALSKEVTSEGSRKLIFNPASSTTSEKKVSSKLGRSKNADDHQQPKKSKVTEQLTSRMANVMPSITAGKKLKVPKHQAFANMSFEDESTTSLGSASSTNKTNSSSTTNSSSSSNAVTITRC